MNCSKIIFIGGIHGVGKGTISKRIIENLNLEYLSASRLLSWEKYSPDLKNKKVTNFSETQTRLIHALKKNVLRIRTIF